MFRARHRAMSILAIAGGALSSAPALAGGFYLQEQSPLETGRALSGGAAAADDPSTVYFNPAAMTALPGIQISTGAIALLPTAHQGNRGTTRSVPGLPVQVPVSGGSGGNPFDKVIPVPSFYATAQVNDRLWAGIGVNAPFGLKLDYDPDFFGRYDSLHTDLKTYNIQPSLAFRVTDNLSVGGGVDAQYVKVTLTNALPNLSPAAPDGLVVVKGNDWSFGWNLGAFYTSGGTNFGVHYRSRMKHDIDGRYTVSGLLGPIAAGNVDLPATAPLTLPDILTVSLTRSLTPRLRAMLTARWYNWSVFREINIQPEGAPASVKELHYRDSYSMSVGGEYDVSDRLTLRGGTMFDRTPTNPQYLTTRVPDGDRVWLSGGATFNLSDAFALNVSYAHNFVGKANIIRPDEYYPAPATVVATTRSLTSGNADQFAASLTARF